MAPAKKEEKEDVHEIFNLKDTQPVSSKPDETDLDLATHLAKERAEWSSRVTGMAEKMKDIRKLNDLQTELHSNSQICLEHCHFLMSSLSKINKEFRKKQAKKWDTYMANHDRKMKQGEASIHVEGELSADKEKIELLEAQIEYFRETNKNIVNMIFGIKYVIQLEEFKHSNSK